MAYEEAIQKINRPTAVDLSAAANLYTGVTLDADGAVIKASVAGGPCIGILNNDPKAGDAAAIAFSGVSKAKAGVAITAGDPVSVRADSTFGPAAVGNHTIGTALVTAAAGDVIPVLLGSAQAQAPSV